MFRLPRAILTCLVALASLAESRAQSIPVLFHGGNIALNDGRGTLVEALLSNEGRVVAVGKLAEVAARPDAQNCVRIDLHGATAVPGLQDAHGNLEAFARSLEEVDLSHASSYEDVIARVKARAAELKPGTWILGRGWDQNTWVEPDLPHHFLLSTAVPKHPVYLERVDGHAALVNAAALALAKLDTILDPPPKVPGGRVLVDESHRASGVLLDAATELVRRVMPEVDVETRTRQFLAAQEVLLSKGLTCVHDLGTSRATLAMLETLRKQKKLALRVVAYVDGQGELKTETLAGLPLKPDALDILSVPGVRLVCDGALSSRGAALLDEYADMRGERGLLLLTEDEINARVALIARAGLQPAVHAIGDRANRIVLDAFERMGIAVSGFRDLRPRIEHAQLVAPKDWARFPELGVVPSMQPAHAMSDMAWISSRLGTERTRIANNWRALAPELGRLAFGSDFPYESPDPLRGLYAARTRPNVEGGDQPNVPEQRLDGASALAGFTSGAAYAAFQEDRRGRLQPGYACDMSVLSVDPVSCPPEALLKASVRATVINGVVVWRAR